MDGHTFCITVLKLLAFNYDYRFFGKTWLSLCWCRYAQSLSVALLWEKMLECLIVKSLWAPRIFYLLWWDNSPFKLISLPSRYSFAQPVRFSLYISRAPSFQPIQIEKLMTDLIRDGLPCWHRKGAGFDSFKQDKRYIHV